MDSRAYTSMPKGILVLIYLLNGIEVDSLL